MSAELWWRRSEWIGSGKNNHSDLLGICYVHDEYIMPFPGLSFSRVWRAKLPPSSNGTRERTVGLILENSLGFVWGLRRGWWWTVTTNQIQFSNSDFVLEIDTTHPASVMGKFKVSQRLPRVPAAFGSHWVEWEGAAPVCYWTKAPQFWYDLNWSTPATSPYKLAGNPLKGP